MGIKSNNGTTEAAAQLSEEWIVALSRSEHTWDGFLRDSPETLTLAIVDKICLRMNDKPEYGWERCCLAPRQALDGSSVVWTPGYSVLETSLLINEDILKGEGLRCYRPRRQKRRCGDSCTIVRQYWRTDRLKKDSKFSLGGQGCLTFYRRNGDQLIMEW